MAYLEQGLWFRREMTGLERVAGTSETGFSRRVKRVAERLAVM